MSSMIRFSIRILAASLVVASAIANGGAAVRGGVQAVVFPRWNAASVQNLVAAVNTVRPPEFELSQAPFFGSGDDRWGNTLVFLRDVNGSTRVVGTFFLSFHTDQIYSLERRATNLGNFLVTPKAELGGQAPIDRLAVLILSPQLEDQLGDEAWKAQMTEVLDKLDESKILRSGKLRLRRSSLLQSSLPSQFSYARGANRYSFEVRIERHGIGSVPTSGVWSNDGDFVFDELSVGGVREDSSSMVDAVTPFRPTMSLRDFSARATITTNLWRPAYNLWRREVRSGRVTWTRDAMLPAPWDRVDGATTFDEREKQVLMEFLVGRR